MEYSIRILFEHAYIAHKLPLPPFLPLDTLLGRLLHANSMLVSITAAAAAAAQSIDHFPVSI